MAILKRFLRPLAESWRNCSVVRNPPLLLFNLCGSPFSPSMFYYQRVICSLFPLYLLEPSRSSSDHSNNSACCRAFARPLETPSRLNSPYTLLHTPANSPFAMKRAPMPAMWTSSWRPPSQFKRPRPVDRPCPLRERASSSTRPFFSFADSKSGPRHIAGTDASSRGQSPHTTVRWANRAAYERWFRDATSPNCAGLGSHPS